MALPPIVLSARVVDGRRKAQHLIANAHRESLFEEVVHQWRPTWTAVYPGSLNLILDKPLWLSAGHAVDFQVGLRGKFCLVRLSGFDCLGFRPRLAPPHILEVWSPVYLRNALDVASGDVVTVEIVDSDFDNPSVWRTINWYVFWWGREDWYYKRDFYTQLLIKASKFCGRQ